MDTKELMEFDLEIITNDQEYNRAANILEYTDDEYIDEKAREKIQHISTLLKAYDDKVYPPSKKPEPQQALAILMEAKQVSAYEVLEFIKIDDHNLFTSDELIKEHKEKLAEYFAISSELFER